jgi:uncharacterized membrane protein YczE
MKRFGFLLLAVSGNALGVGLMLETDLGASAWGAAATNVSRLFDWSEGFGFLVVSMVFYAIAIWLRKAFVLWDAIWSIGFLLSFSTLLDLVLWLLPDLSTMDLWVRIAWNVTGLLVLLYSIALHLRLNIAVHPMDVFLQAVQQRTRNVTMGTYIAYACAFLIAVGFGLMAGGVSDIGIGTLLLLVLGGSIMGLYDKWAFFWWKEPSR